MANGSWGGPTDRHPFKVRIAWTHLTSVQQTGFHLMATGATVGNAQNIANEVEDWVNDSFRVLVGPGNRFLGVDVVDMVTREGFSTSPASMMGSGGGLTAQTQLPSFMAVTVQLKSGLRTRHGQGRMFWPVANEQSIDGDGLSSGALTVYQSVLTNFSDRFVGGSFAGYQLVNVHGPLPPRAASGTTPARPALDPGWYDVVSTRLNSNVTFLRSRKMGVGS